MTAQGNVVSFPGGKAKKTAAKNRGKSHASQWNRRFVLIEQLPFVGPEGPPDGRSGVPTRNYWTDEPTGDSVADCQRGRRYAQMTIAMITERRSILCAIDFEHIIEGMIRQGIARREKGGRYSRAATPPAMRGFLFELSRYIAKEQPTLAVVPDDMPG